MGCLSVRTVWLDYSLVQGAIAKDGDAWEEKGAGRSGTSGVGVGGLNTWEVPSVAEEQIRQII